MKSQLKENHQNIRNQFKKRKKANENLMNKIMNKT